MTTVAVCLSDHCSSAEKHTFRGVCNRVAMQELDTTIVDVSTGDSLLALAYSFGRRSVDHLVIAAHGGPTWILSSDYGVTTSKAQNPGQVSVHQFVAAWAPKLTTTPLISLAACLCSRSPAWFLQRRWGYVGSDWGKRAYLPGGEASLSARIRDYLVWYGLWGEVRGHRTVGHASFNPILAAHKPYAGTQCKSWWEIENPGKTPTREDRVRWVKEKWGLKAEAWLMGRGV